MRSTHEGHEADGQFELDELRARIFDIADSTERHELTLTLERSPDMPVIPLETMEMRTFSSDIVQPIVVRTGPARIRCNLKRTHTSNYRTGVVSFAFPLDEPPSDAEIINALERLRIECLAPQRNVP